MDLRNGQAIPEFGEGLVLSLPPSGKQQVLNIYQDPVTGKIVLEVLSNQDE